MSEQVRPFRIGVPDCDLDDLRDRLRRTRWPERETVDGWSQGVPLGYLRDLCGYWESGYDWRASEARLNRLPQFTTEIDGVEIHFVHARSTREDAMPLVMTHGWPGSFVEFSKVIGPLSEHFHVVCPSLPGYAFSGKPDRPGWGIERIADAWDVLMKRLGYPRYAALGSDWGTSITTRLGQRHSGSVIGIHLVPPLVPPDPATFDDLTPAEAAALTDLTSGQSGDGYSAQQSTRPQTIGYALVDSPAALCGWIVEKLLAWTDGDVLTRDDLLDLVMMYWLPGTGASAARLYWESFAEVRKWFTDTVADIVTVPAACSVFPRENPRPSRRWAERRFTDIRYWGQPERGGHFAAYEQPGLFIAEVISAWNVVAGPGVSDTEKVGGTP